MRETIKQSKRLLHSLASWYLALAPFVWRTLTLTRPFANLRLKQASSCDGLDEYFALEINGHPQWLRIRGRSPSNPIVLYLHGGPGGSQIPSFRHYQLGWEADFTIVHWEQRGAGKSYSRKLDPATVNLSQLVDDALVVIDYLRERFGRNDIILLGHSWGTLLAVHVLLKRSRGISVYVGLGQVAHQVKSERRMYDYTLEQARSEGNKIAVDQLSALKCYPVRNASPRKVALVRYWARNYGFLGSRPGDDGRNHTRLMTTPEYGLIDVYRFLRGSLVCAENVGQAMLTDPSIQPMELQKEFAVPMFLVSGRRDHFTPTDMADQYLQSLTAPEKGHVIFDDAGHYPNEDDPIRFLQTLHSIVDPYLQPGTRGANG